MNTEPVVTIKDLKISFSAKEVLKYSQTVNAAKITYILINLLTITFVIAGPSLIVGLLR